MDNQNRLLGRARPHLDLRNFALLHEMRVSSKCRHFCAAGCILLGFTAEGHHLLSYTSTHGYRLQVGQFVSLQPILLRTACCCCVYPEATPDDECYRFGASFGVSKQSYLLKLTCLEVSEPLARSCYVGPSAKHSTTLQAQVKSEVTAVMLTFLFPQTCQLQWLCLSPRRQTSNF